MVCRLASPCGRRLSYLISWPGLAWPGTLILYMNFYSPIDGSKQKEKKDEKNETTPKLVWFYGSAWPSLFQWLYTGWISVTVLFFYETVSSAVEQTNVIWYWSDCKNTVQCAHSNVAVGQIWVFENFELWMYSYVNLAPPFIFYPGPPCMIELISRPCSVCAYVCKSFLLPQRVSEVDFCIAWWA